MPFGFLESAERNSTAALLIAPAERTNNRALIVSLSPPRSTSAATMRFPRSSVSRRVTRLPVCSRTFACLSAGSMSRVSASPFAPILHGNASHVPQRMQVPPG